MAIMIPEKLRRINNKVTEGEEQLYHIIQKYLPESVLCFYNLRNNGLYSDFIIIHPNIGLVVLEVKDLNFDTLEISSKSTFVFKNGSSDDNPIHQVIAYMRDIENDLKKEPELTARNGRYKNRLLFPRGHGLVLSKVHRNAYLSSVHRRAIEPRFIIFKDDLDRINQQGDTEYFSSLLKNMFTKKFSFTPLTQEKMLLIRAILNCESSYLEAAATQDEITEPPPVYSPPPPEQPKAQAAPQYTPPPPAAEKKEPERSSENPINPNPSGATYRPPQPPTQNNAAKIVVKPAIDKKRLSTKVVIAVLVIAAFIITCYKFEVPIGEFFASARQKLIDVAGNSAAKKNEPFMVFKVNELYTYIGIGDKRNHPVYLEEKKLRKNSTVEFYNDKTIVVTYPDGKKKEIIADCDILYLEVANEHTTVYYKDQDISPGKALEYFRYSFATDEILMGWKEKK